MENEIVEIEQKKLQINQYDRLLPEAVSELRSILHRTEDEKLRAKVAEDIINLSSHGKTESTAPTIVISNSNVQLLLNTAKEALRE
jgi:hypothetical protein